MEQALLESEKRYRNLIKSLQEGLFVIQNGKFVFLNNSIVDIVGYTVEELTGRSF
ncbi:MAG: PAS domain S-box protein [Paludibacteraceae bacterium]